MTRTGLVEAAFQRMRYARPEVLTCPYFSGIAPPTRTFELPESASRAFEKSALQSSGADGDEDVQIASGSVKSVRTTSPDWGSIETTFWGFASGGSFTGVVRTPMPSWRPPALSPKNPPQVSPVG